MNQKDRETILKKAQNEPFAKKFQLTFVDLQKGYAKVAMVFTPDMENIFGMAHGGAIFSLMDAAFEIASNSHGTMAVALVPSSSDILTSTVGLPLESNISIASTFLIFII